MALAPRAVDAGDTLDSLVDQFSDQYAFLRELIQNSIDANSTQVWVRFEFNPFKPPDPSQLKPGQAAIPKGIFIIHIEDTGDGMNREIIDTQLTRLFSSSKEHDMTKIGKFGIGFVSVFALEPNAVIVDTGRNGEYWRIFFEQDRKFKRFVLDHPVEGTHIQFIKEIEASKFDEMRDRCVRTIKLWCKHAEAEIYVDGEQVNERFEFDHPYAVTHEVQGTTVYLAPSNEERPFLGFYNRGLTLYEAHEPQVPGVTFKIRSRYVEHTLTRDNVIKDENYHKAMGILRDAVDKSLRPRLFEAAAQQGHDEVFGYLAHRLEKLPEGLAVLGIFPTLQGVKASVADLQRQIKKHKELFYDRESNHVTAALAGEGHIVLRWYGEEQEPGLASLLKAIAGKAPLVCVNQAYVMPIVRENLAPKDSELLAWAAQILNKAGSPYKKLVPADLNYPSGAMSDSLYLAQAVPGQLQRIDKQERKSFLGFLFGRKNATTMLVNMGHPLIEPHFRLRKKLPAMSAFMLAKALTLDDGIAPEVVTRMLEAVLKDEVAIDAALRES